MYRSLKVVLVFALVTLLHGAGTAAAALSYTVQRGDTVSAIARYYGTTTAAIAGANNLDNPNWIYPGQVLTIPGGGQQQYTVVQGDTVFLIARRYAITVEALVQANSLANPSRIYPGQVLVIPGSAGRSSPALSRGSFGLSSAELDLLARLVRAEAGGEPYAGQVAVAASVLNRVSDSRYPNTLSGVIYQVSGGYYQYCPVQNGTIHAPAGATALQAARDAMHGWDPSYGATGFYNPSKTTNQWVRSQPVTTVIGNHIFFK